MDISKIIFSSNIPIDKIIATYTGSFTATISPRNVIHPIPTNINDTTYFQGIFSIDNGTTWNDFGTTEPIQVFGMSQSGVFNVISRNKLFGGSQYTVLYKVVLIAKPTQGIIPIQDIGTNTYFNSNLNYQKILSDTTQNFSVSSGGSTILTFDHDLGYVPKIRPFVYTSNLTDYGTGMYEYCTLQTNIADTVGIRVTTTKVYVDIDNTPYSNTLSGIIGMRIYYD